jgi:soluble lytic murein transglycosylase-like protein
MLLFRPTNPPASRHRCRRRSESGPAFNLTLAGLICVTVYVTAASPLRAPTAPAPADALRKAIEPAPVPLARPVFGKPEAAARVVQLTNVVARRYRVAGDAASEVVRAAFTEGRRHGLDPMLILAVIAVESRFNPFAASEQGALGLMQIVPRFHKDKLPDAAASMLTPETNIALGARILKDAIQRGGSDAAGLQLYNGSFDDETRAYANRVLSERRRLEDALPKPRA